MMMLNGWFLLGLSLLSYSMNSKEIQNQRACFKELKIEFTSSSFMMRCERDLYLVAIPESIYSINNHAGYDTALHRLKLKICVPDE